MISKKWKYAFRYLFDPEVPFTKKIWIILVSIYFLSPIDFIPDPLLGPGFIDDVLILIISLIKLSNDLEKYAADKNYQINRNKVHRTKEGPIIDVDYKVHDK